MNPLQHYISALSCGAGEAGTISATDRMFVTVSRCGRTVCERMISGIGSMEELLSSVRSMLGDIPGLLSLRIRNASQGWSTRRTIRVARQRPMRSVA